jgi:hypothetical protein
MVEVFKTNVGDYEQASWILDRIHEMFKNYIANFDLEDCDHILRVQTNDASIEIAAILNLIENEGFYADILEDQVMPLERWPMFSN